MSHAIQVHQPGGPEVLRWEEVEVPDPGPGQVRIRNSAVGLNYIDVYFRTGLYPAPSSPFIPGMEGVGIVEALGSGVKDLAVGDRVAYGRNLGGYAQVRLLDAEFAVKVPDSLDDQQVAAMMLQGMTTEYLLQRTYKVRPGDTILFHAAAGGVGLLACQWAKALGATVIGTVGSKEKAELARAHGCDHTILYKEEDFVARVKDITKGAGVPVVYDSVGKDTLMRSMDCLRPRGMLVSFGQSSGKVDPFDIGVLSAKGSLYLTRPTLMTYTSTREDLLLSCKALFDMVGSGKVKVRVGQTFALKDAADAHRALESRQTTGSTVLVP
jgi:NADPH2:quinone reductase